MRYVVLMVLLACSVSVAEAGKLSADPEVAEFQKLKLMVREQYGTGVASRTQLLKAEILENRARYLKGELGEKEWLAREQELNAGLLKMQTARVAEGLSDVDKVFAFQNELLTTRALLKRPKGDGEQR